MLGLALAVAVALPLVSWFAFARANLLIDPVRPLIIGACAATAMWIALYVLARAERTRLAAALVEQRISAAEQEGELKAARRIQLGMVPGPERLAALDPRVGVGAVLFPARSVGGDFYDAVMVAPDRLLSMVNAGHENPLIVRADGNVASLLLEGGPPLCVVDFPYREERHVLDEGDTLVLITDGATEAENAAGAMFGLAGVIAALEGEGEMTAEARAGDLAGRVRAFEGDTEPSDDLTIVALRYRG